MATFYGSIKGGRGEATRCGTKNSGIKASVQSWNGSVISELSYAEDRLMVRVSTSTGSSSLGTQIFYGTFEEFVNKLKA